MRVFIFLVCLVVAATGPWWLTAGALLLYAAYWQDGEVLIIAVAADVFFHQVLALPLYTVVTAVALLFFIVGTPLLKVYNDE